MSNLYYDDGGKAVGQKVCLATTVYDTPSAGYVFSIQKTRQALEKAGIASAYLLLQGNCHVDDARNNVIQHFLLSDCTDLIFIDADVSWEPLDLIKLIEADADLVGGIYPYRREGSQENLPVLMIPGETEPDERGLIQVAGLPTGFMKIRRHVLESLSEDAHHYWNKADRRSKVPILFERTFEDGVRWGGDITFCRKWHKKGGKMYAHANLHLGHTGNITLHDSLSAALRRQGDETLKYMVEKIRGFDLDHFDPENLRVFTEARQYLGNNYGALEDVLSMCMALGKKTDGPVLETGSGLTSIVLAASTNQPVYCLEHDIRWAAELEKLAKLAGVENIHVRLCEIEDQWYKLPKDLPEFALGLNDGPPRKIGNRLGFFDHFGDIDTIIVDDADHPKYSTFLKSWAADNKRKLDFMERSALIRS